jgi:hypothetical protein
MRGFGFDMLDVWVVGIGEVGWNGCRRKFTADFRG